MENLREDILSQEVDQGIDNETSGYLIETSKWAKFIAITFYILTGIFVLFFLFYWDRLSGAMSLFESRDSDWSEAYVFVMIILAFVVAVVVVTYYFLLDFANKIRTGIESESIDLVNRGLRSLKTHFIIIGILLILMLISSVYGMIG